MAHPRRWARAAPLRRVVVQVLTEPSLDFGDCHPLALVIVVDLIAVDLSEAEVARFRMGEVETAYAGPGPHCEGLGNQHSGIRLHIEKTPERALFGVVRACRVTSGWADTAILFLDEV